MTRRRTAVAAVVTSAAVLAACQNPAPSRPVQIGMGVHMIFDDAASVTRQFDLLARMKISLVRVDFDWSAMEGERGLYDWAYTDRVLDEATARGMEVLAVLTYTPGWARPAGTSSHQAPDHVSDFAGFASAAVTRYAPRGLRSWEIWNEPNIADFWQPRPDVDRYGQLFRAAAAAIRAVNADATVVTGGMTRGTTTRDGKRISQLAFLRGLYRNGAARDADAIGVHPYSFPALPNVPQSAVIGGFSDLPALHVLAQREGDRDKKIWITEFGAATGTADQAMSDRRQADSLEQARRMAEGWDWVGPLIYYELRDSGTDRAELEQNFGVMRADLSPKDAAEALMK